MNTVVIVGRLTDDPKKENNKCNITLAVTRSYKNEEGIYETDYIECLLWKMLADNACDYLQKGDVVGIKGRLQTKNGRTIVMAERVTFLSGSKKGENNE